MLVPMSALCYLVLLYAFWPLVTAQDMLPIAPLLTASAAGALLRGRVGQHLGGHGVAAAVVVGLLLMVQYPPWQDQTLPQRRWLHRCWA